MEDSDYFSMFWGKLLLVGFIVVTLIPKFFVTNLKFVIHICEFLIKLNW